MYIYHNRETRWNLKTKHTGPDVCWPEQSINQITEETSHTLHKSD